MKSLISALRSTKTVSCKISNIPPYKIDKETARKVEFLQRHFWLACKRNPLIAKITSTKKIQHEQIYLLLINQEMKNAEHPFQVYRIKLE